MSERETGRPVVGVEVRAYDKDRGYDDLLGVGVTDGAGNYELRYEPGDFQERNDKRPDLYLRIVDPQSGRVLHTTASAVRRNAGDDERIDVALPRHKAPAGTAPGVVLLDTQGRPRESFEVGESLAVELTGLRPNAGHHLRLLDGDGREVVSARLVADRHGVIARTVLWPDVGIGDEGGGRYANASFDEALGRMSNAGFTLEVAHGRTVVHTAKLRIEPTMSRTRVYPTDARGRLRRGLLAGEDDLRVRLANLPPAQAYDVYLVPRQFDWRAGDAIRPVVDQGGREIVRRVEGREGEPIDLTLWTRDRVRPGSYDVIVRPVTPGEFRAEQRTLRESDIVSERLVTTLVVRDDIFRYKPILGGCAMVQEIAAKRLPSSPYIQFVNNFPRGTDVWAALDPAGLMPGHVGKKVRYYVVPHKTSSQWSSDPSLADVTGTITEIVTTSGCINGNAALVWSNPQAPGKYDIVADFGNQAADPTMYATDGQFNQPPDMIDGYVLAGFHVTDDPSVAGPFAVGQLDYSQPAVTIPAVGVWGPGGTTYGSRPGGTFDLPINATVRYPATVAGSGTPVSGAKPSYPLFVIMHGNHSPLDPSWLGYNYLLDHLASHGFIAVSIDCNSLNTWGMQDTRAHAMLEHLAVLASMNANPGVLQGKIDLANIAIGGHSRGGDGAVYAEILNQSMGLGFAIKGVIALSPTDFSGVSPTPLVLSTSKFLGIYGGNDGDVWGGPNPSQGYAGTGFRFYDRATVEKSMVFVPGATHNRFNTEWGTEFSVDSGSPKVVSATLHQTLLKGYVTAFLQVHLLGRLEQNDYFNGELRLPAASTVDAFVEYQPPARRTLDHFESAPATNVNSLGGPVTPTSLADPPAEGVAGTLVVQSPHQTRGLKLRWNAGTAKYESEIPLAGANRDVSAFKFLQFRVSQVPYAAENPTDQPQDLYVRLKTAAGGPERAVRAAFFGDIPFPYKPEYVPSYDGDEIPNTKAAFTTVRIPLHAFTIKALSAPIVDLTNVQSVVFEFGAKPTGNVIVDDVEFTE